MRVRAVCGLAMFVAHTAPEAYRHQMYKHIQLVRCNVCEIECHEYDLNEHMKDEHSGYGTTVSPQGF